MVGGGHQAALCLSIGCPQAVSPPGMWLMNKHSCSAWCWGAVGLRVGEDNRMVEGPGGV